jgi:light-regulated signal transduction histidine kinase (bacteriophytochrome)
MGNLIDDLLAFSRIGRAETKVGPVSLGQLVTEAIAELRGETSGREIAWKVGALPVCVGDRAMLKLLVLNLLSNAIKFSRTRSHAVIGIGCTNPTKGRSGSVCARQRRRFLICSMSINYSVCFSVCTEWKNSKVPG